MRSRSLSLCFLAACGGGHVAPAAPVRSQTLAAGMFVAGNAWRYQIHRVDEQGKPADSIVTCTVGTVTGNGHRSVIACDGDIPGVVAGVWATDAHGLYYLGAPPGDDIDPHDVEIPFPPKESSRDEQVNEGFEGHDVTRDGDRWCTHDSTASQGDDDEWVTCFDVDGIASYHDVDTMEGDDGDTVITSDFARLPR